MNDEFYIGYLPKAPAATARHVRRVVALLAGGGLAAGVALALLLPYLGDGIFEFGRVRDFRGVVRCDAMHAPRLSDAEADYLLVGPGKHGVVEMCGADGQMVTLAGTLITRDGRRLIETAGPAREVANGLVRAAVAGEATDSGEPSVSLGNMTLTGEIVDPKCYFGVMNPAEGRAHRACAILCLRGGITPVFVARDRAGATAHLLITGPRGEPITEELLRWVGEGVSGKGEVVRTGRWLTWRLDPATLGFAGR
ncbi:MAG: hypothetical protein H7067_04275 [Burkholderiales bacterium]|nr:hypothetical protein [Opitutaceae bacterium]